MTADVDASSLHDFMTPGFFILFFLKKNKKREKKNRKKLCLVKGKESFLFWLRGETEALALGSTLQDGSKLQVSVSYSSFLSSFLFFIISYTLYSASL